MAALANDSYGGVPTTDTEVAKKTTVPGATDANGMALTAPQPDNATALPPSTTPPPTPAVPTTSSITPPSTGSDTTTPSAGSGNSFQPPAITPPTTPTTPAFSATSSTTYAPGFVPYQAPSGTDAASIQATATAEDAANNAAHLTTNPTSQSQGTDPYGRNNASPSTYAGTSSNTFSPTDGLSPQELQAYRANMALSNPGAGLILNPDDMAAYNALGGAQGYAAIQAKVDAGQAKSSAAIANGFDDPAIRAGYWNPDGTPKPQSEWPTAGSTGSAASTASAPSAATAPNSAGAGTGAQAAAIPTGVSAANPGTSALTQLIQQFLAQQSAAQTAQQQARAVTIQQLRDQYITPGAQTTANNTDPLSAVSTIDPTNDLRSTVITDTPDARTASYKSQVDNAAAALPTDPAALAKQYADGYLGQIGNTSTDVGKDYSGDLNATDGTVQSQLAKLTGTDRQALVDSLMSKYTAALGPTDVTAGAALSTAPSDRLKQLQSLVDGASSSLAGVDRYKLAQDQFGTYANETDPAFQLLNRQATQRAAAAGGLGGGNLRTSYGDLALQRSRDLQNERDTLFQNALNGSIQDQFNKTSALSGLEGQLSSEELAQLAAQQNERQYGTDVQTGNVNRGLSARQAAAGLASSNADANIGANQTALNAAQGVSQDLNSRQQQRIANQGANVDRSVAAKQFADTAGQNMATTQINNAQTNLGDLTNLEQLANGENLTGINDLRGERSYQVGQANDSFTKALAQYQAEQAAKQQAFTNSLNLLNVGDAGNPSGTQLAAAGQVGAGLDANGIAQLAASLGQKSAAGSASGGIAGLSGAELTQLLSMLGGGGGSGNSGSTIDPATQAILNQIMSGGVPPVQTTTSAGA